jgi:hypothetical protein
MCLFPKLIRNKRYCITNKNAGIIPEIKDIRHLYLPAKCNKCIECRKQTARDWNLRLQEDIKNNKEAKFVTFTFNNEEYNKLSQQIDYKGDHQYTIDNNVAKLAVRRYLERVRKETGKSLRHWLITELGQTRSERLHIHGIIYGDSKIINKHWKYGYTYTGDYVNESSTTYLTKYMHKPDIIHKTYQPIILCTKGIGRDYINTVNGKLNTFNYENTKETYTHTNGKKTGLPKYYRDKLYNDDEREYLWSQLLDKDLRYVLGQKIENVSTEKGMTIYNKALKYAQNKNKQLGYGDDSKNWDLKRYENDRRKLIKKRLKFENI